MLLGALDKILSQVGAESNGQISCYAETISGKIITTKLLYHVVHSLNSI